MSSERDVKGKFNDIYNIEITARDTYDSLLKCVEDPYIIETFTEIYEDEKRHVDIAKRFLEIVSKG